MPFWTFRKNEEKPEDGVLQIDGVLQVEEDWWGDGGVIVARKIRQQLNRSKDVTVYINSPGGDVMAGAELYTALREHSESGKGHVTVKVSGIAASAASIVAMAGDEVLMSPVAYMMIHNPWTALAGNSRELRKQAEVLDRITEGLINAYQIRTGKSRGELEAMLEAETYMDAQTCVAEGFADGILYGEALTAAIKEGSQEGREGARMQARAYGREATIAALERHGVQVTTAEAVPPIELAMNQLMGRGSDVLEAMKRAEMARRAGIIAQAFG